MKKKNPTFERYTKEFDAAWDDFFSKKSIPKTDEEEQAQLIEFTDWYNHVRKQSDTGKAPAEMGECILNVGFDDTDEMLEDAMDQMDNREYEKAASTAEALLGLDPQNETAFLVHAEALINLGKFDEAEESLNECLQLNPSNDGAYLLKALAEFSKLNPKPALELVNKSLKLNPKNFDSIILKAQLLYWSNDENYKKLIESARKLDAKRTDNFMKNFWFTERPEFEFAKSLQLFAEAEEALKQKEFKKVPEIMSKLKEIPLESEVMQMCIGYEIESLLGQNKLSEASEKLKELLNINPKCPHAYLYMADVVAKENKKDESLRLIDKCIQLAEAQNLKHPDYYFFKAGLLKNMGNKNHSVWAEKGKEVYNENLEKIKK